MNVFLVECAEAEEGKLPTVNVGRMGRYEFSPNPAYKGRRVVEVPSQAAVEAILARNPPGRNVYVQPTDLLALQDEELLCQVVERHFGIKRIAEEPAPNGAPEGKPKRKRKTGA